MLGTFLVVVGGVMRLCHVLILLVGASVLAPLAGASHVAAAPAQFNFSNEGTGDPFLPTGLFAMYRDPHPATIGTNVAIGPGVCREWVSDEKAGITQTITAQTVTWRVVFFLVSTSLQVNVTAGIFQGAFVPLAPLQVSTGGTPDAATNSLTFSGTILVPSDMDLLQGDRLAFRVCVQTSLLSVTMKTGGQSSVTFTSLSSPPFPTPELGTIALTATGLLGILGLGLVRRRKL